MQVQTPDWVKNAVFYQIFPDRFARSPRAEHPRGITFKAWGAPPEEQGFQGGDLYGVTDKLDYLKELGINALYLNPIFASACNHRYHTFDYMQVDPLLGGDAALLELLDEAHRRDIRVVLDGVFNHASRGFWQFNHILEEGGNSPYIDWFIVHDWPLRPYHSDKNNPPNYEAWVDLPMLPKFNHKNPGVRQFIMDVARYWLDFGIDGWRLDVPAEIDDDSFWQEFRQGVKGVNPDAYIVGEIWDKAQRWLQGDQFDAVMNYTVAWSSMSFFGAKTLRTDYRREHYSLIPRDAAALAEVIDDMHSWYDWEINHAQLNLLDSHDTARALWVVGGDKEALRLSTLFLLTLPGAPCIYYGDEVGMSGADDPYCRAAFPWDKPETWDNALLAFYKQALALRNAYPVLRTGTFRFIHAQGDVLAFERVLPDADALVVFNAGQTAQTVTLDAAGRRWTTYRDAWAGTGEHTIRDGGLTLTVPGRGALVLV